MPVLKKSEWIRPSVAAKLLGVHRGTVVYRAGQGRYATRFDDATGVTLVSRRDIEREARKQASEQAAAVA